MSNAKNTESDSIEPVMRLMLPYGKEKEYPEAPRSVPFSMLDEPMAYRVHTQTLKRLSERGGLDPREMLALMTGQYYFDATINGKPLRGMDLHSAVEEINKIIDA